MSTATKSRKRVKPERRVSVSKPVHGGCAMLLTIGTGEKAKRFGYYLHPIPADFGLGFHVEKFGAEQQDGVPNDYDVNLDLRRGYHSCTCKGNTYHGHCKHVESILALIGAGKIDSPQQPVPTEECDWDNP